MNKSTASDLTESVFTALALHADQRNTCKRWKRMEKVFLSESPWYTCDGSFSPESSSPFILRREIVTFAIVLSMQQQFCWFYDQFGNFQIIL